MQAYWGIFSPMVTTWLLLRISGVAMPERTLAVRKPGHERCIATTSAFIPRPPRRLPDPDDPSDWEA